MKLERLEKLSKDELIKLILLKSKDLEFYNKRFDNQKTVGQIFIEGKMNDVIFERREKWVFI